MCELGEAAVICRCSEGHGESTDWQPIAQGCACCCRRSGPPLPADACSPVQRAGGRLHRTHVCEAVCLECKGMLPTRAHVILSFGPRVCSCMATCLDRHAARPNG